MPGPCLARAGDDALTVYACEHRAVLLTHDVEFSTRRRKHVIGHHVFLRCNEWDGVFARLEVTESEQAELVGLDAA